ncbi:MAG: CBS domain-containing protein [Candidatus Aenigmatarchaeota archaeon]|jgi:CBS domain-containing protein
MFVKDIMSKNVITISPEENISKAIELMAKNNISGLVVVENEKVVGIISESDILEILKSPFPEIKNLTNVTLSIFMLLKKGIESFNYAKKIAKLKVKDLMTKKVFYVGPNDTIEEAARIMSEKDIRRLPVIDEGKLVGIISRTDILRALME